MLQQLPYWPVDKMLWKLIGQMGWILFACGAIILTVYILCMCVNSVYRLWILAHMEPSETASARRNEPLRNPEIYL